MTLRRNSERKTYSADIRHRTFGRVHLALRTKVRDTAMQRHAALEQLLNTGESVRDLVDALRAEKLTIEAIAECVRGKHAFDTLRPSTWPLLQEAANDWVADQERLEDISSNTVHNTKFGMRHLVAFLGERKPVDRISYDDLLLFREHLRGLELATNTIVLIMAKVSGLFTYLQKRETRRALQSRRPPFVLTSPLDTEVHVPSAEVTRVRFLIEAEVDQLLTASPDAFRAAPALGVFGGLRLGEVEMLRPNMDVDLDRGIIYVQARDGWQPKYGRNREVPISQALEPHLRAHVAQLPKNARYLFTGPKPDLPSSRAYFARVFGTVLANSELKAPSDSADRVTFHTLRHTFASWLVMGGADLFTVARLMGHASTKEVEKRYAHLSPQHKLATVELMSTRWLQYQTAPSAETESAVRV